jgi:mRNA interferase RelE/StbE
VHVRCLNTPLRIKASAARELDALDHSLFLRVDNSILALADTPRPAGCKKLQGHKDHWRIRIGNWRVVYTIDDAKAMAEVTRVRHRSEAYIE